MTTRIRVSSLIVLTWAAILLFGSSALAESAGDLLNSAQSQYKRLLTSEQRQSSKSMWLEVVAAFDLVVKKYPGSDEAAKALFTEGCIYREMFNYSITLGELYKAEDIFNRFLRNYPKSELASEAKKNIEEIRDQKKNNNLVRVSTEKPNPETFPGRDTALTSETAPRTSDNSTANDTTPSTPPAVSSPVSSVSILKIRYFTDTAHTRIVVDLDSPVPYNGARLPSDEAHAMPPRIYVDLFGARTGAGLYSPLVVKDGLVSRIRWSNAKDGKVRLVLELEKGADYTVFSLKNPCRLVIDVLRN